VAPAEVVEQLRTQVDEVVCLAEPVPFRAVGLHYGDFHQVDDEEVVRALHAAELCTLTAPPAPAAPPAPP
jgi:putative phosphoribosyl transferase